MDDTHAKYLVLLKIAVFVIRSVHGDYSMITPTDLPALHFRLPEHDIPQWSQEAAKMHVREMLAAKASN